MGHYATNADVAARLPGQQLTSGSKPSTTDVDNWITQAEAALDAELALQSITVPVTDTKGIAILQDLVTSRATSRWKQGVAEATNSQEMRADAAALKKEFDDFIALIRSEPARVASMLGQAPGTSGGAQPVSSYVTDNKDGLSISNGDFAPMITKNSSGGGAGSTGRW